MLKKAPDSDKVFSGIQIAKADLPDRRHGALLHAVEQIHKIPVKVVIDLEGINRRLAKKDASRTSEHIDKSPVLKRKESIQDVQDGAFVSHTGNGRFHVGHLTFEVPIFKCERRCQSSFGDWHRP